MDLLAELSQHVGGECLSVAHLLDVRTVFSDDVEQLGRYCHLTLEEPEERVVHFLLSPLETSDFLRQDLDVPCHLLVHLRQPLQLTALLLLFLLLERHFLFVHVLQLVELADSASCL